MIKNRDFSNLNVWIPEQMRRNNIDAEHLYRKVNICRANVYRYINDVCRPSSEVMRRMCKVFNVPFEEGMGQYSPKPVGRPVGSGGGVREVSVRRRK